MQKFKWLTRTSQKSNLVSFANSEQPAPFRLFHITPKSQTPLSAVKALKTSCPNQDSVPLLSDTGLRHAERGILLVQISPHIEFKIGVVRSWIKRAGHEVKPSPNLNLTINLGIVT